jgi:hypothetical protein
VSDTYGPFEAGAGYTATTEAEWRNLFAQVEPGVIKSVNATWDMNRLQVYADSTGMQVKVKSGRAMALGQWFKRDAEATLAIAAADPTNPRIDLVVLRNDQSANTVAVVAITGTAAASPSAPAVVQTPTQWDIPLAQVAVAAAASTIAAGNVTDRREYQHAQTGILASVTRTAAQALSAGVAQAIPWTASVVNWGAMWDSVTNPSRLTCRVPGVYRATGGLIFEANATGDRLTVFQRNGVTMTGGQQRTNAVTGGGYTAHNLSLPAFALVAGDYLEMVVVSSQALATGASLCALSLERLGAS